jgi:hypothetical protein
MLRGNGGKATYAVATLDRRLVHGDHLSCAGSTPYCAAWLRAPTAKSNFPRCALGFVPPAGIEVVAAWSSTP